MTVADPSDLTSHKALTTPEPHQPPLCTPGTPSFLLLQCTWALPACSSPKLLTVGGFASLGLSSHLQFLQPAIPSASCLASTPTRQSVPTTLPGCNILAHIYSFAHLWHISGEKVYSFYQYLKGILGSPKALINISFKVVQLIGCEVRLEQGGILVSAPPEGLSLFSLSA